MSWEEEKYYMAFMCGYLFPYIIILVEQIPVKI